MNKIQWTNKATRQLMRLAKPDQKRVYDASSTLVAMPRVRNVKALTQYKYGYQLRVGNYRILFDWDGMVKIVSIEEVRKRDKRTY